MDLNTIFDGWGTELISILIVLCLTGLGVGVYKKRKINSKNNNKIVDNHSKKISAKSSKIDDHSNLVNNNSNITINGDVIIKISNEYNFNQNGLLQTSDKQKKHIPLKDYSHNKSDENKCLTKSMIGESQDIEREFDTIFGNSLGNNLDCYEKQILLLLNSNSSMSVKVLSQQLNLSESAIVSKLKKLNNLGIIVVQESGRNTSRSIYKK